VNIATDPCVYTVSNDDDVTSDLGSANDQDQFACCITGNCTFHSFEDTLTNVTNNVVINIETSVVLTTNITIVNVDNVLIKGKTVDSVLCANAANLAFVSCSNLTIEGIIWQRCGGLHFYNSSNITIQDCYFNYSSRQAVVMSEISEYVCIKNCQFKHNNYSGHGSAIHYSSLTSVNPPLLLSIHNCSFTSNGPAESVVYLNISSNYAHLFSLQGSIFVSNQGVPLYLLNTHAHILGTVLIRQNTANCGGGIFSTNCNIEIDKSSVHFYGNSATVSGGAVYIQNSNMTFGVNSLVRFENNDADVYGGAIFS